MEEDSNGRACAGKKDYIKKQGECKQTRVMLDTLYNFYKLFAETPNNIMYSTSCKLQLFWIVQPHCDIRNTCIWKLTAISI